METFLTTAKKCLENLRCYKRVRVIMGNQTCDLDSAVCALAHGFFEYQEAEERNELDALAVIPVFNVTKDEFRLKTEVVYYLKRCNVSRDLLTFRNEIDLVNLYDTGKLELVLVDHHVLSSEDIHLTNAVIELVDHRPKDSACSWNNCKITLEIVGSCATLVARNILNKRPDIVPHVGKLLQGAILIDTANFSKEADRATPLDHEIMEQLEKICNANSTNRAKLFAEILDAKTDISELTPSDLLIRDLKVVNGIPLPGFPILVKDFLELENAWTALEAFCTARQCQLVVLLGMELKRDTVLRDIAVYSLESNHRAANKLIEALTGSTSPDLQLTEAKRKAVAGTRSKEENGKLLVLYKQANVRATRKQILPIIQSASSA